jgi:hypothetical protein
MADVVQRPAWVGAWIVIVIISAACAAALLVTDVGQLALVDERVRVVEAFGGSVSDAEYAALQSQPPWWVYFTSGSRSLLLPPVTLAVAVVVWMVTRGRNRVATFAQSLAIAVHASAPLVLGQVFATPLNYVRETLTSPLNLAAILPVQDGTAAARIFGAVELFGLWWIVLLAIGMGALTGVRARRYALSGLAVYFGFAAVMAGVIAAVGGT